MDLHQGVGQVQQGQVGKHSEGDGVGDGCGHAGEVEIGILNQLRGREAGFIRDFRLVAAFEQRAGQICRPIVAGGQVWHRLAA